MDPVIANLTYWVNADFSRIFQFVDNNGIPYNFTGSTFKCEVRPSPGNATLTKSLTAGLGVADIVNGRITINWLKADIAIGVYAYDLLIVTSGKQSPIMKGALEIKAGVTA